MRKLLARWRNGVFLLLVFVLFLLPRLSGLGHYVTPDELIWVFRTVQFREAVLVRAWSDTLVSGHPGITTTWLGMLGISLQLWLRPESRLAYEWITHLAFFMPDNTAAFERLAVFLTSTRMLVAVVNSLGGTAVYLLVRRLWNYQTAWLAALLLALDPFTAGLSGILHVDALMTTFATLSLLTLLLAVDDVVMSRRWWVSTVSGVMAALAVLSKTPALLLVPIAGLVFVVMIGRAWRARNGRARQLVLSGFIWGMAALITILAAYPALWAGPGDVVRLLSGNAGRHIEEALRPSFFLGQVTYNHGPLFYPVVLLFRLSPVVLVGLIVGAALIWRQQRTPVGAGHKSILLLLWAVLYIGGITFAAKKFDRYALAVIPALIILAAVAWSRLAQMTPTIRRYWLPVLVGIQALYLV
ncbi:MAG: glycosyltransferase family 39 protein, partial [Ardenticatenaceae bacterium]|nr:glycosyltransferase family 39 protein [Ardenticatenaceae bacterium]